MKRVLNIDLEVSESGYLIFKEDLYKPFSIINSVLTYPEEKEYNENSKDNFITYKFKN